MRGNVHILCWEYGAFYPRLVEYIYIYFVYVAQCCALARAFRVVEHKHSTTTTTMTMRRTTKTATATARTSCLFSTAYENAIYVNSVCQDQYARSLLPLDTFYSSLAARQTLQYYKYILNTRPGPIALRFCLLCAPLAWHASR